MTAVEKYLKGLEMEKTGASVDEVIAKLGYKDKQSWYATKSYQKNRQLTERAAAELAKVLPAPEAAPILAGLNLDRVPVKAEAAAPAPVKKAEIIALPSECAMKITVQISAEGKIMRYRITNGKLFIGRQDRKMKPLSMTLDEFIQMAAEVTQLMKPGTIG